MYDVENHVKILVTQQLSFNNNKKIAFEEGCVVHFFLDNAMFFIYLFTHIIAKKNIYLSENLKT